MVLLTDEKQMPVSRWTWYVLGPGKVRQMAEQSNDGQRRGGLCGIRCMKRLKPERLLQSEAERS